MQTREVISGVIDERLHHHDGPRMGTFMHHLNGFLHHNKVSMVHGSSLYEFGYLDPQNQRGLYYAALDRDENPHKTWVFKKAFRSRRTEVHLVDNYTGHRVPVQVYGKEGLNKAIAMAEQYLVLAQKGMIKSPLDSD